MSGIAPQLPRSIADGVGIVASSLCALHCLAVPVLLVVGAAVPAVVANETFFHGVMLGILIPSALLAFGLGCSYHKDRRVLLLGALGIVGISIAAFASHDVLGENGERIVTLAGTAALVTAHWRNYKLCRVDDCDHEVGAEAQTGG